jgi:hypothetical protein
MQRISVGILASGIFLIGLTLAFLLGARGRGHLFLPILFTGLAFTTLMGSIRTLSPQGVYGGIQGFFLQLGLGISLSRGLLAVDSRGRRHLGDPGTLFAPIISGLTGMDILGPTPGLNQWYQD